MGLYYINSGFALLFVSISCWKIKRQHFTLDSNGKTSNNFSTENGFQFPADREHCKKGMIAMISLIITILKKSIIGPDSKNPFYICLPFWLSEITHLLSGSLCLPVSIN